MPNTAISELRTSLRKAAEQLGELKQKRDRGIGSINVADAIDLPDLDENINLEEASANSARIQIPEVDNETANALFQGRRSRDELDEIRESVPTFDLEELFPQTELQDASDNLLGDILSLTNDVSSRGRTTERLREQAGIGALEEDVANLGTDFQNLLDQEAAIPLQLEEEAFGRGQTQAGAAPIQAERLRKNAIAQLSTSTAYRTATTRLNNAVAQLERKIDDIYRPREEALALYQSQLAAITPFLDREERKIQEKRQLFTQERQRLLQEEKNKETEIQKIAMTLRSYGAPNSVIADVLGSDSIGEALFNAGNNLQDPVVKLREKELGFKIQEAAFDRDFRNKQLALQQGRFNFEKEKFNFDQLESLRIQAAEQNATIIEKQKAADAATAQINNTLMLIEQIRNHPGRAEAIGVNAFQRSATPFSGERDQFQRLMRQLTSSLTLENTKFLTGTISDADLILLQDMSSPLNPNEKGNLNYQEAFLTEQLDVIANKLIDSKNAAYVDVFPMEDTLEVINYINQ